MENLVVAFNRYKRIQEVTAWQFTIPEEIAKTMYIPKNGIIDARCTINGKKVHLDSRGAFINVGTKNGSEKARLGDWIVTDLQGHTVVERNANFKHTFVEAEYA